MVLQSGSIFLCRDNQPFVSLQLVKLFLDEQQVFLAEVMVVAELQQIDAGGVGFHFFHQWGGRGDARNE